MKGKHKGVSSVAQLVSKERHSGVADSSMVDVPGASGYYKCVYRYSHNGRDRTFRCRIVGEPPVSIQMNGRHVSVDDPVLARMTGDSRSSFTQYRGEDELTLKMVLLAVLPCLFCVLVGIVMFCATH